MTLLSLRELFENVTHKKLFNGSACKCSDYEIYLDGQTLPETFMVFEVG